MNATFDAILIFIKFFSLFNLKKKNSFILAQWIGKLRKESKFQFIHCDIDYYRYLQLLEIIIFFSFKLKSIILCKEEPKKKALDVSKETFSSNKSIWLDFFVWLCCSLFNMICVLKWNNELAYIQIKIKTTQNIK